MMKSFRLAVCLLALAPSTRSYAQGCAGDIVADGRVDGADLGVLLAYWGPRTTAYFSIVSDINDDGSIDGIDLGILLSAWGACPSPAWGTVLESAPDPTIVTDPSLRAAIESSGLPWRVRDNGTGIELLLVPAGVFQMGCTPSTGYACLPHESPVHSVVISTPFYLGRFEVTQSQWISRVGSNPSRFQGESASASQPVEQVSWDDVQGFLAGSGLRLPSEAEWEFACRAGTVTAFSNGANDEASSLAVSWSVPNSGGRTHGVGLKPGNRLGFHDMHGNVWEWVNDWYGADYYASSPISNPLGPASGSHRIIRGGSWKPGWIESARSSHRWYEFPSVFYDNVGFRVARNP